MKTRKLSAIEKSLFKFKYLTIHRYGTIIEYSKNSYTGDIPTNNSGYSIHTLGDKWIFSSHKYFLLINIQCLQIQFDQFSEIIFDFIGFVQYNKETLLQNSNPLKFWV